MKKIIPYMLLVTLVTCQLPISSLQAGASSMPFAEVQSDQSTQLKPKDEAEQPDIIQRTRDFLRRRWRLVAAAAAATVVVGAVAYKKGWFPWQKDETPPPTPTLTPTPPAVADPTTPPDKPLPDVPYFVNLQGDTLSQIPNIENLTLGDIKKRLDVPLDSHLLFNGKEDIPFLRSIDPNGDPNSYPFEKFVSMVGGIEHMQSWLESGPVISVDTKPIDTAFPEQKHFSFRKEYPVTFKIFETGEVKELMLRGDETLGEIRKRLGLQEETALFYEISDHVHEKRKRDSRPFVSFIVEAHRGEGLLSVTDFTAWLKSKPELLIISQEAAHDLKKREHESHAGKSQTPKLRYPEVTYDGTPFVQYEGFRQSATDCGYGSSFNVKLLSENNLDNLSNQNMYNEFLKRARAQVQKARFDKLVASWNKVLRPEKVPTNLTPQMISRNSQLFNDMGIGMIKRAGLFYRVEKGERTLDHEDDPSVWQPWFTDRGFQVQAGESFDDFARRNREELRKPPYNLSVFELPSRDTVPVDLDDDRIGNLVSAIVDGEKTITTPNFSAWLDESSPTRQGTNRDRMYAASVGRWLQNAREFEVGDSLLTTLAANRDDIVHLGFPGWLATQNRQQLVNQCKDLWISADEVKAVIDAEISKTDNILVLGNPDDIRPEARTLNPAGFELNLNNLGIPQRIINLREKKQPQYFSVNTGGTHWIAAAIEPVGDGYRVITADSLGANYTQSEKIRNLYDLFVNYEL